VSKEVGAPSPRGSSGYEGSGGTGERIDASLLLTNPFAPSLFDYQLAPPSNVRVKPTENQRRLVELSERCVESEPKSSFTRQSPPRTEPRNGADVENVEHREQQDEAKAIDAFADR
jgi:hypothetical protein